MRQNSRRIAERIGALFLAVALCVPVGAESLPLKDRDTAVNSTLIDTSGLYETEDSYGQRLEEYTDAGYQPGEDTVLLTAQDATVSTAQPLLETDMADSAATLHWESEAWVEWHFTVATAGLYTLELTYCATDDGVNDLCRGLQVDGTVPFSEARELRFYRHWRDAYDPKVNALGNEVKPQQEQIKDWITAPVVDSQGIYDHPLRLYLSTGAHTLRLLYIDGPMMIRQLALRPAEILPDYAAYRQSQVGLAGIRDAETVRVEAETAVLWKNQQTVQRQHDGDPITLPKGEGNRLNVIGGENWDVGGQAACFTLNVPQDGYYKLAMRVKQSYGDGLPTHRQITIDGAVPFAELSAYAFRYERDWYIETLSDGQGEPFLFYFTAGEHTVTLTVLQGEQGEIASALEAVVTELLALLRRIRLITGNDPDVNYDYQLPEQIPGLLEEMQGAADRLRAAADWLETLAQSRASVISGIKMVADQLENMVNTPDSIARRLSELSDSLSTLSTNSATLREQALTLDCFLLGGEKRDFGPGRSSVWQKLVASVRQFFLSFFKDYDAVGSTEGEEDYPTIEVWVSRGQEWAEVMKQLIDDRFAPEHHIHVRMNLLPASQLNVGAVSAVLLAVSSGDAPDVATSVAYNTPAEFAFRRAVTDLSVMPDYTEITSRFYPQILVPVEYNGGVYALPETMNFRALFYRKDILSSLGLGIPNTWEDVYVSILPVLAQNGMQFYYPKDPSVFLYQYGADYYNAEGTRSALDTPTAYQAIKEYTELFTVYGIPQVADFFNRFRSGEMPIGIESTTAYLQLLSAAPELTGKWGVALVPGHEQADGSIRRGAGGLAGETCVIFSQSTHKEEAWEFLKWWTSTDVQVSFGRQVESILGTAARWNSANIEAYQQAAWNRDDLAVFLEQMAQMYTMPTLPGSYMNTRHLDNMWNRIVLEKISVRDSVEQAAMDINRELISKAEEFSKQ